MGDPGEFQISPQSLQSASQQTQRCAGDLAAAVDRLRSRVLGSGSPWGNDEMGTLFAAAYTECTQRGLGVLNDLSQHLEQMASSLAQPGSTEGAGPMSVMLPGQLVFVLNLIGFNWPTADEDKLKECAQHWREYASELEHLIADHNRIGGRIRAENRGCTSHL